MAPATLIDCQVPPEFEGEAERRVETLRALVAEGERLALHEARTGDPQLRVVARWQRASLALLGLALLGLPIDFVFGAHGAAFAALVVGVGGHFIVEQRIDALIAARERLFESGKQELSLQWLGLGGLGATENPSFPRRREPSASLSAAPIGALDSSLCGNDRVTQA
ncbi:hypothetical protein [Ramlibacter sp. Leaf400]|uniref:hypothetical protein n=1 Tax=Ramlibacter sp. Leaf400 TaxID=1736365 RepID=UPI0006F6CB6E|nr:hypothetical protein [Ramlibacter sp. Leaf400]KQT12598.1 hypothetical protein ASG30_21960 [Ramlibacter sp. Leaf400]